MKVTSTQLVLIVGSIYTVVAGWLGATGTTFHKWHTYQSPDYGFAMKVPADMTFFPGGPASPPQKSMIPICDRSTVACFQYNGNKLNHTVIQAMGISVNILRDKKTEAACNNICFHFTKSTTIHGRPFEYADTGSVASGSSAGGTIYRTYYQHVCFEIAVSTAQSDIPPEQYAQSGVKPLNQSTLRQIHNQMDRMLRSFTFVGPVNDGAAWNVYNDWGCGGLFEYPAASTVKNLVPYTMAAFRSHGVTCEQEFTHNGRIYNIAAKVDLRSTRGLNDWLISQGFPGLNRTSTITRGEGFTKYTAPTFTCFFVNHELYILTLSDENHNPIPTNGDKVFTHLVDTFKLSHSPRSVAESQTPEVPQVSILRPGSGNRLARNDAENASKHATL
jgi:hypothetical protein